MMGASLEEINRRIANESQMYLSQMSKLRAELSSSYLLHSDHQAGTHFSGQSISGWDESRVRMIVQSALALYDADKTGMADYALESQGTNTQNEWKLSFFKFVHCSSTEQIFNMNQLYF